MKFNLQKISVCVEDLDDAFANGTIKYRPNVTRVDFDDLREDLDFIMKKRPERYAIIASVPSRLDEDRNVMQRVQDLASKYDDRVKCAWSSAQNTGAQFERARKRPRRKK